MDRYELFHQIMKGCDIASSRSILRATLDTLINVFGAELGGYFAVAPGGPRCLTARSANGADLSNAEKLAPSELFTRVLTTKEPMGGDMPRMTGSGLSSHTVTGKSEIFRFLATPAVAQDRIVGVCYLERRRQKPSFQNSEILLVAQIMEDIQNLLTSSSDYEKQSYELDDMRSKIAMNEVRLISRHPSMLRLFRLIQKLAKVPSTVLIHGESGTGKELVARAIYELGQYEGPYISMNCGGIEPNLMKSELFGYVKGSFTGAAKDRPGLFRKAEGGVLFMDEIGEMPMDMQVAMLRAMESGEILALGSDIPVRVNTRVIAATHRNLREMVQEGEFRNDLYQRLKGLTLEVPPLRKRRTDIPLLAAHFIKKYNQRLGLQFQGLRPEAMALIEAFDFNAGNVRELEHMIERAMVFEDDDQFIGVEHLAADEELGESTITTGGGSFEERMNRYAVKIINETIESCEGNKTKAMKRLGLSRSTFYGMLHRYGLS